MSTADCRTLLKLRARAGAVWRKRAGEPIQAHYGRGVGRSLALKEHPMGQKQQLTSIGIGRLSFCRGFLVHIITCTMKLPESCLHFNKSFTPMKACIFLQYLEGCTTLNSLFHFFLISLFLNFFVVEKLKKYLAF